MKKISVVVPVFYNEQSLGELFESLIRVEKKLLEKNVCFELIFVDDGSGDNSLQVLLNLKKNRSDIKIIKLARNFGAARASKTGLCHATGDAAVVIAADLQDPPELIEQMAERWLHGSKFVICARGVRHDPLISVLFANFFYFLLRLLVVKNYPPRGYDLALMDKSVYAYLKNSGRNINLWVYAYWLGFKPDVITYERQARKAGKSRWSFAKRMTLFIDSILGFSVIPIRFISFSGIAIALASFAYGITIVVNTFRGLSDMRGFPTIVSLLAFLLGLAIFMIGILGEYLWRILDEVNRSPETVVDEVY